MVAEMGDRGVLTETPKSKSQVEEQKHPYISPGFEAGQKVDAIKNKDRGQKYFNPQTVKISILMEFC